MKAVAQALEVSRSNLVEQRDKKRKTLSTYRKPADADLLPIIRQFVDDRPTYGYRRITALVNRHRLFYGQPRVNHKCIFRIMKQHNLLLQQCTGRRIDRAHTGKVVTLRSNLRWCSDGFDIHCWNGDIVRVAFSLDTCDREAIAWAATTTGISGEIIRDLMLLSVEKRFGTYRAPHHVEWLSDNGSGYTAEDTLDFAAALGLLPKFTPVRSPESNGMAESFVKTFKRDYVRINPCPDAETVIASIDAWFEDYNRYHPHRGLKMLSPREFIKVTINPISGPAGLAKFRQNYSSPSGAFANAKTTHGGADCSSPSAG